MNYFIENIDNILPQLNRNLLIQRKQAPPALKDSFGSPELNKVQKTLDILEPTFKSMTKLTDQFEYGLIYAVRISEDMYHRVTTGNCEIVLSGSLKKENIVQKVKVENIFEKSKSSQLLEAGRLHHWKEILS